MNFVVVKYIKYLAEYRCHSEFSSGLDYQTVSLCRYKIRPLFVEKAFAS